MGGVDGQTTGGSVAVTYVCTECGRVHYRNSPPCNDCGSMNLAPKEDDDTDWQIDEGQSWELVRAANREITGITFFVYLVGIGTFLFGVFELTRGNPIPGVPLTAAGVVATPAARVRLERRFSTHLSAVTVLAAYLVLFVGGLALDAFL